MPRDCDAPFGRILQTQRGHPCVSALSVPSLPAKVTTSVATFARQATQGIDCRRTHDSMDEKKPPASSAPQERRNVEDDAQIGCGESAITRAELERFLRSHPDCLDSIQRTSLRPTLFPLDDLLAQLFIVRDQLRQGLRSDPGT